MASVLATTKSQNSKRIVEVAFRFLRIFLLPRTLKSSRCSLVSMDQAGISFFSVKHTYESLLPIRGFNNGLVQRLLTHQHTP
jgi:hypothetical protein